LSSAMRDLAEGRPIDVDPRLAGEFDATAINRASARMSDLMSSTALGRTMDTAPDIRLGAEPDPRAIFREIAPDIAARVDEIQTRMDTQRRWLDELRVSAETQVRADFDPRIDALQARAETASAKNRARLTKEIDALTAERDAALERARTTDTPDAARVRQAVLADELKLRELAPEMSAAMREAERKARARTPRIESRIALADAIARRRVDFSPGLDIDAVLRQADPIAATPARAAQAAQAPADATPTRSANPERKALESDTDALLAELEVDPRHAETAKAARADLARAAAFDEAAPAAASCLKG
ncbi:MAG: hypothetical protein LCH62_21055, partial [Proteobacteria bacterium]|nr:hypothetical protein [Pseudomonadota bacterium]